MKPKNRVHLEEALRSLSLSLAKSQANGKGHAAQMNFQVLDTATTFRMAHNNEQSIRAQESAIERLTKVLCDEFDLEPDEIVIPHTDEVTKNSFVIRVERDSAR